MTNEKEDNPDLRTEQIVTRTTKSLKDDLSKLASKSRRKLGDYVMRVLEDAAKDKKIV